MWSGCSCSSPSTGGAPARSPLIEPDRRARLGRGASAPRAVSSCRAPRPLSLPAARPRSSTACSRCAPACPSCGLDLRGHDAGDGPAVAGIFVLGVVIVVAALWVELAFEPPLWLHAVLWPVLSIPLALAVMRPAKAALIALQYRHRRREMQGG
ncbi:MAG: DUF983 domain-containing protein [Acetobacteraceae bacterium]|nr:DUF983 domain-containing protein [Acetobacteraceae bacterium]